MTISDALDRDQLAALNATWSARFYDRSRFAGLTPRQWAILEPPNARYGGRPTA